MRLLFEECHAWPWDAKKDDAGVLQRILDGARPWAQSKDFLCFFPVLDVVRVHARLSR